ncbi:hypothetical protein IAT40_000502 [Kwoniella sp. CBS 6097]
MSGIGLGLGLGLSSVELESATSATIISQPNITPRASSHPAYIVPLQPRSHRGPRSLGVGKRFVSSPSPTLLPTIYDKSSSNPLSIPSNSPLPFNSPQLELDLVHINPAQHLRAMRKRSLASRNFGLGSSDPLDHSSSSTTSTMDISSVGVAATASSPTIGSSPTLGYSSPVISSPVPHEHHIDMVGPSIALSVVLGLIVLGVAGWAGFAYRRRVRQAAEGYESGRSERDSDEKSFTSEMFAASNVVEKGLKPRTKNPSTEDLRSSFISYKRPTSAAGHALGAGAGERRVSFVDTPHEDAGGHDRAYYDDMRSRRQSMLGSPRVMIASIVGDGRDEEEYYEGEEEGEKEYEVPTPSPRSSIAPTLERIEEEEMSIPSSGTQDTIGHLPVQGPMEEMDLADVGRYTPSPTARPVSVASSVSSADTSDYTTASARSSISSLSALSVLSSSFPPTPRDPDTPSTFSPQSHNNDHHDRDAETSGIYDSPTPASKFQARRKRAQSQGVMEVKHDLLRTAVGRTMSLQPSKEVVNALRKMTAGAEAMPTSDQGKTQAQEEEEQSALEEMKVAAMVVQQLDAEAEAQDIADQGYRIAEMGKSAGYHRTNSHQVNVPRSTSFPAKLLSRRKSQHQSASPSASPGRSTAHNDRGQAEGTPTTRRSEDITDGYLKRALRAFRGEGEGEHGSSVPALPSNIPMPNPISGCRGRQSHAHEEMTGTRGEELESIRHLAKRQAQLERYLALIQAQSKLQTSLLDTSPSISGQQRMSDNPGNCNEKSNEYEDEDMDLEDSCIHAQEEAEEEEAVEQDSVWDAEGYGADMEMEGEAGLGAFDEYYLYFEGDEGDQENNEGYDTGYGCGYGYQLDHRSDAVMGVEMDVGRGVPHIRVTSH